MDSVKCETQRQIIVDFYQKRISNRKALQHECFWAVEGDKQSGLLRNCLN